MLATIQFNQDTHIVIQDTLASMPYAALYRNGTIEHVDILSQQGLTMHVQFEDGSVGWIQSSCVEVTHKAQGV